MISWVKAEYNDPIIYLTENGYSDAIGNLDDLFRDFRYLDRLSFVQWKNWISSNLINNVLSAMYG